MKYIVLILVLTLMAGFVSAQVKQITVLSVSEQNQTNGGLATVYLEVRPGIGAVYIDSYPLTKLDTQLSARFAREYACQLSNTDCSQLDFFYIIRAPSSIIGGPSAGAAMTILSYATLTGANIDEKTVMTGTINSGGIVGPVGGVPAKVQAAKENGFDTVLIPQAEYNESFSTNEVEVIPVLDIEQAIYFFTGNDLRTEYQEIVIPHEYTSNMARIAESLCERTYQLSERYTPINNTEEQIAKATTASAQGKYYSAASHCFTANLALQRFAFENRTQEQLQGIYVQLEHDVETLNEDIPTDISNIADLEIYMIVRERLLDVKETLATENKTNLSASGISYAVERYSSALAWSSFFGKLPSKEIDLSQSQLSSSCSITLAEAEERINYIRYLTGLPLNNLDSTIRTAYAYQKQEEWELCIFEATKAKAEADSIISSVYSQETINATLQLKQEKIRQLIASGSAKGNFPILSYSYLEYSQDLENVYSANLYAEYALGLAGLEIYFPPRRSSIAVDSHHLYILSSGLAIGFAIGVLFWELLYRQKHKEKSKKKVR